MNNYCDICNVELDAKLINCPICGRNINNYSNPVHSSTSTYPKTKTISNKPSLTQILRISLLCLLFIGIAIEFFLTNAVYYSWYGILGFLFVNFAIILPIKHKFSLSTINIILLISTISYLLFIELFSNSLGWGVQYTIPFILIAFCVYNVILMVSKGYLNFDFLLPILLSSLISTIILIICYVNKFILWANLSAFLLTWVITLFLILLKYKKFKNNIKKKFHL